MHPRGPSNLEDGGDTGYHTGWKNRSPFDRNARLLGDSPMKTPTILALCALLGGAGGCVDPNKDGSTGQPGRYFVLGIEQDGQKLSIRDHEVTLKKRPFEVLVAFSSPDAVLVNASFHAESYEAAKRGTPIGSIPGFAGSSVREELFNKDRTLIVGDETYHNWKCYSQSICNFDEVTSREGAVVCRRTVAKCQEPGESAVDVANIDSPAIYLVFIRKQWSADPAQRVEKQRDYLKIAFE
jgi:hypothetical protein